MLFLILGAIILVSVLILFYFFCLAFVRRKEPDFEDMNCPQNKPIKPFCKTVSEGISYINSREFEWVYTLSFDGLRLAARYFDNGSRKTMILFHGYRSAASRDFSCAVKMYTDFGFNILLVDQRSHGRSEGRLITFGVKESRDVLSWVEYVKEKFGTEIITLGGMSMGATTVLLSAGLSLPQNVKCIIADSSFTSPADIIKKVGRSSFKINAAPFLPLFDLCCKIFGKFSILKANTVDAVKDSNLPILFVHGKADNFVPCDMSQSAYDSACDKCKILLVDDAGHGMGFLVDEESVKSELKTFLSLYAK